jgi:hypothetical protein
VLEDRRRAATRILRRAGFVLICHRKKRALLGNQSQFQPQLFNKLDMFWSAWRECLESTKHLDEVSL